MMTDAAQIPPDEGALKSTLEADERWLLVQRILTSEGFQRADQLRKILLYISRSAILEPSVVLHEYEIACNVLGRRKDFDPASDNIVRAQFTHLRRKLERYFREEGGLTEPLFLTIPKGSYIPLFAHNNRPAAAATPSPGNGSDITAADEVRVYSRFVSPPPTWWSRGGVPAGILLIAAFITFIATYMRSGDSRAVSSSKSSFSNGFLQFLARSEGNMTVVVPDTSELMIQMVTGEEISAADYAAPDYPHRQIDAVKDPAVRYILSQLAQRRNTTISEAKIAFDFLEAFNRTGLHGTCRHARDQHVRDFNDGNTILIGSHRSNPWVSLFTDKTNFQYLRDPTDNLYYFQNVSPQPGEQPRYVVSYKEEKNRENYVDVALMPNPSRSGFILLINGTDAESNEAAANLLLHGRLPPEVVSLLARKDLRYFELFLRGKHIVGESEDSLQVVSIRPNG